MSEPFLHWTSDLDTGIEQVDEQHKILVQYINEMHDAMLQATAKPWAKPWTISSNTPCSTSPTKKTC